MIDHWILLAHAKNRPHDSSKFGSASVYWRLDEIWKNIINSSKKHTEQVQSAAQTSVEDNSHNTKYLRSPTLSNMLGKFGNLLGCIETFLHTPLQSTNCIYACKMRESNIRKFVSQISTLAADFFKNVLNILNVSSSLSALFIMPSSRHHSLLTFKSTDALLSLAFKTQPKETTLRQVWRVQYN